ncbi:MAG TPA: hypothetical protein PKA88_09730 [Polyangiaceae bacterium]|mgnify:CR=1 FL=1|nr:hypothetical protein [Polyangiaceae bacterium]
MTYVVGLKFDDSVAIICDEMVSDGDGKRVGVLKSGRLFPGCAFAVVGDARAAGTFISTLCTEFVDRLLPLDSWWELFVAFARDYESQSGGRFELLLATRHGGSPSLSVYDSHRRTLSEVTAEIVTLGSGRPLLDSSLMEFHRTPSPEAHKLTPSHTKAFQYCLFLMQRSLGDEVSQLEERGVGGAFHYLWVSATEEGRQARAAYLLYEIDSSTQQPYVYAYRVFFADAFLVVEDPVKNTRRYAIDAPAWPKLSGMSGDEKTQWLVKAEQIADSGPYYQYCGMAPVRSEQRYGFVHTYNYEPGDPLISDAGTMSERAITLMVGVHGVGAGQIAMHDLELRLRNRFGQERLDDLDWPQDS